MKNVLFVTSRQSDARELFYRTRGVWNVSRVSDAANAPTLIETRRFDLVFFDLALTGAYAPDLLRRILSVATHPPVIILSREYSFNFLKMAQREGVCGFMHIPYATKALIASVERFLEVSRGALRPEDPIAFDPDAGESALAVGDSAGERADSDICHASIDSVLLGKSAQISAVRAKILDYRRRTEPLMIYGETGTGKDLVARLVHRNSPVAAGPYTVCNVSCIPASLAESLLFGTVKGSFTDSRESPGVFEVSNAGTLFLDEVGELDVALQPKFLRVIEDKTVTRLGSTLGKRIDFRLVCATNRRMDELVASGRFRADLFHRIDVLRIQIPPLREHPEDIPSLASSVLRGYRKVLSMGALDMLLAHGWPGNVRELFNCVTRAACDARSEVIFPENVRF